MFAPDSPFPRRGFIGRLALLAAPLAIGRSTPLGAQESSRAEGAAQHPEWLDRLTATHRTAFDVDTHRNGNVLVQAASFLDAWQEAGVPAREVNLVLGVRGTGLPLVMRDELWARYRLGAQYSITDTRTGQPATRNPFVDAGATAGATAGAAAGALPTVEQLQKRGALFLVCMNTIKAASRRLASGGAGGPDDIAAALRDGVLPGVVVVPAMVVAFTLMQERGVAYVYMG